MAKQDLIRKITSRKFFALIIGLVTSLGILFKLGENETAQIIAVVGAFGTIIAYIFGEAEVDAASVKKNEE